MELKNTMRSPAKGINSLWLILGLRSLLFLVEFWVGWQSHSLSLLAGSGHLFADLVALGLTLLAAWLIQHQSTGWAAFHYRQINVGMGLLNGLSLTLIAMTIGWQAIAHLKNPEPFPSLPLLIVAALSVAINTAIVHLLREDHHHNLNLQGVFLHGVADAVSSIGLILAALAVYFFNWLWADSIVSLAIATLIGISAVYLITDSLRKMQATISQERSF